MSKIRNIVSLIRRAPKRTTAVFAMIAAAIIVPAVALAWGPDRPTYTWENPADHITFNSITDNPVVGDERNFVRIKDDSASTYGKSVTLQAGHTYDVSVYYHNNAASNLNLVAHDTTLRMQIPGVVNAGGTANINGYISASNATPGTVWDTATATNTTSGGMALDYVANSATVTSLGAVNGAKLPDSLFTTGALLGYNSLNGDLPGCNQYAGYVTFKFVANQPNFTVSKYVRIAGTSTWSKNVTAKVGQTVQYELEYNNTGTTDQDNVVANDYLPKGINYVAGTTLLKNAQNPNGKSVNDDLFTTNGMNIGNYAPGANAYMMFNATVVDNGLQCGTNTLTNTGRMTTSGGYKQDTATVTVNKECAPQPTYTCNGLTASLVSGSEYSFSGSGSASNGASITGYSLDFGDGSKPFTGASVSNVTHTYAQTGATYTARLTANVSVNGKNTTVTGDSCTVQITVGQPPVTPTTPGELPHTGPTTTILGIIGLGSVVASLGYFIASRRALGKVL